MRLEMTDFTTRGVREDGTRNWAISGGSAVVRGPLAEVSKVRVILHVHDGGEAVITSPKCVYNQNTGIARSDAPIHVASRELTLDGVGYDISLHEQQLRVRSGVHMKLRGVKRAMKEAAK